MGYHVRILADSVGANGVRLTTWELTYPRFVHAELMTHRRFSRNSASSRAIPTTKLLDQVKNDPAMPVWWGKNQSGMQAREELGDLDRGRAEAIWLRARDQAVDQVEGLLALGLHKQIANRILEPWMFITVIVTATEFENWFRLRCHPDAQPEIGWVAREMKTQYETSLPRVVAAWEWHRPLITLDDELELVSVPRSLQAISVEDTLNRVAVARCARVSYLTHDGRRDFDEDVRLHDRLAASGHWSPFEHVAQAQPFGSVCWSGNFRGWTQYRQLIDPNFTRVGG
jgi:thymidylate synthase ThyX